MGQACSRRLADKQATVVVLGLQGSGKTTFTYQLSLGAAVATVPTIGFNLEDVVKFGVLLNFWDVGGEPMYRCSDAIIFVVDSSDHDTLDEAAKTMYSIFEDGGEDLENAPLLVICNKQDAEGAVPAPDIAERFDMANRIFDRQFYCQSTNALTGDGCDDGLRWLAQALSDMQ